MRVKAAISRWNDACLVRIARLHHTSGGIGGAPPHTPYPLSRDYLGHRPLRASMLLFAMAPDDCVAPNASHRRLTVKAKMPKCGAKDADEAEPPGDVPSCWMARLKQVFAIQVSVFTRRGGQLRVLGEVTEPHVVASTLEHVRRRDGVQALRGTESRTTQRVPNTPWCQFHLYSNRRCQRSALTKVSQ